MNGNISDAGIFATITKTGPATLFLAGNNSNYSGEILVNNGTAEISATSATPGSIYANTGGSVSVDPGATITCLVIATGTGAAGGGAINGAGGTYGNSIYLVGNTTVGGSETINGIISDFSGNNTLTFSGITTLNAANLYHGGSIITGSVIAANNGAFGPGAVAISQYGSLQLSGNINVGNTINVAGGNYALSGDLLAISGTPTLSGVINLTASNQIAIDAAPGTTLTFTGSISDGIFTAGLKLIDSGTVTLAGISTSTFKGGLSVNKGTLIIINPSGVGSGNIYVDNPLYPSSDSAQLQVQGNITVSRPLFLAGGAGIGSLGLLHSTVGANSWSGGMTVSTNLAPTSAIGVDFGSTVTFVTGAVTGAGTINKVGLGRLVFNTSVGIPTINANAGQVQFGSNASMPGGLSVNVMNGAAAEVNDLVGTGVSGSSNFSLIGNGLGQTGALALIGASTNATLSGKIHLLTNSSIGVDGGDTLTLASPSVIDDGGNTYSLTKFGGGVLVLSASSTYTGGLNINGGTVKVSADSALGTTSNQITINNGAKLEFTQTASTARSLSANTGVIQIDGASTLTYTGNTITGGFLRGTGTHAFSTNSTFIGTTVAQGATVSQTGSSTLSNFVNGGLFNNSAALSWDSGSNAPSGTLNINNAATVDDFTSSGIINIAVGGTLTNTSAPLYLAGGSRTYIGTKTSLGGTLTLTGGTTLEVNGALLVNDGTISGTTDVNYGGTAEGLGSYGPVNLSFGGVFQPGFASSVIVSNGATVTALSGAGTIDNTSTGAMALTLTGNSVSTFSGPIQNTNGSTSLAIQGTSALTLLTTTLSNGTQSVNTFSGGISIAAGGTVTIGASGALPVAANVVNNGSFAIHANSTAGQITGSGTLSVGPGAALTLASSSGTTRQSAIALASTAQLNLTNNFLIVEASNAITKASDMSQLGAEVASGTSTGFGIVTSPLAQNLALAIIDNGALLTPFTTFGGQPVDSNSILLAPELLGDTNIDGHVDLNDLNTVLNNLGIAASAWTSGNFDGAPTIDLNDLNDVLNHLGTTYAGSSSVVDAESLLHTSTAPTPEPSSLLVLALLLPAALRRKSKRFFEPYPV